MCLTDTENVRVTNHCLHWNIHCPNAVRAPFGLCLGLQKRKIYLYILAYIFNLHEVILVINIAEILLT